MAMPYFLTVLLALSLLFGGITGQLSAVSSAAMAGAQAAVELCLSMAGAICLWSGVMTLMDRCGLSQKLARLLRPVLRRLLPNASRDSETLAAVSANVSANLLGLGNAATPLGIRAATRMAEGCGGVASDELCRRVVLNTASIQLLPTTVAAVRSAHGCVTPFDILPSGWLSSALSVAAWGLRQRVDVYAALTDGAAEGLRVLLRIFPNLVALLTAVYMFRASGALDWLTALLAPVLTAIGIPPETTPLLVIRPLSGSGALAAGSELMETYGVDSAIGRTAAVMLGCTETTFYTIAVYFGAAGVRKLRYTIPAALTADLAGFLAAAWCVRFFF